NKVIHDTSLPRSLSEPNAPDLIAPIFKPSFPGRKLTKTSTSTSTTLHSDVQWTQQPRPLSVSNSPPRPAPSATSAQPQSSSAVTSAAAAAGNTVSAAMKNGSRISLLPKNPRGAPLIVTCSKRRYHSRGTMVFTTRAAPGEIDSLLSRVDAYTTLEAISANLPLPHPTPISAEPAPAVDDTLSFLPVPKIHHENLTQQHFSSHWHTPVASRSSSPASAHDSPSPGPPLLPHPPRPRALSSQQLRLLQPRVLHY
ncbi:hypothetical protein BGX38DRAFT_1315839, partial [Terfezia claveryi]